MASNLENFKSHFQYIFNSKIHITPLNFHELPNLIARTMEAADKYTSLTGNDKYILVLDTLTNAINSTNTSQLKKDTIINQLNSMIDNFINVSKGAINVDKKEIFDPNTTNIIQISEKVYNEIKKSFNNSRISINQLTSTLPSIVTSVIKIINKIKKLNGNEKKQIAIVVIYKLLDELPRETDLDKDKIKLYKKITSSLIDTSISIARGKININNIAELIKAGCSICQIFCK